MSNDIMKVKRGTLAQMPSLLQGEEYFAWDTEELYIGGLSGNIRVGKSNITSATDLGCIGDGVFDNTDILNTYLLNGNVSLYFDKGTYNVENALILYDGTTLIFEEGAILNKAGDYRAMFTNAPFDSVLYSGYSGNGNIKIIGGTFELNGDLYATLYPAKFFAMGHGENIILKDCTVKNGSGHALEIAGCRNVLIDSCNFEGYIVRAANETTYLECIQCEIMKEPGFGQFGAYDLTITHDVVVKDCFFGDSDHASAEAWRTGLGNHGTIDSYEVYNIKAHNNVFDGCSFAGISPENWYNVDFSHNDFRNCEQGIYYDVGDGATNKGNLTFNNNNFDTIATHAIKVTGTFVTTFADSVFAESLTITGNTFKDVGERCINIWQTRDIVIANNRGGDSELFIGLQRCEFINVSNNVIRDIGEHAIKVATICYDAVFNANVLNNIQKSAFDLTDMQRFTIDNTIIHNAGILANDTYRTFHLQDACTDGTIKNSVVENDAGLNEPSNVIHIDGTCSRVGESDNIINSFASARVANFQTNKYNLLIVGEDDDAEYGVQITGGALAVITL